VDDFEVEEVAWRDHDEAPLARRARDAATVLLKEALRAHSLMRGLRESTDGEYLYFPDGLAPANRLTVHSYDGTKTWVNAVGERSAWTGTGTEKFRYHLALAFRPALERYGTPVIQVRNRVYLTDMAGRPLEGIKLNRRRKLLCKDWWNREWLNRFLGSIEWLAAGSDEIALGTRAASRLVIRAQPITLDAADGIDEGNLSPLAARDDLAPLDETDVSPWLQEAEPAPGADE
jgi:hypothetical protein